MSLHIAMIDGLEARVAGTDSRALRIGVALPMTGVLGQVGPSALDAVLLAADEIRAGRGRSERSLQLVLVDSGDTVSNVAREVSQLAHGGFVDAFVGLHTSDRMSAIESTLGTSTMPYICTPSHEGVDHAGGVFCSGESPVQSTSGLSWVIRERGALVWAVLGTDYLWPQVMRGATCAEIDRNGGVVLLDTLLPVGGVSACMPGVISSLRRLGIQGVVLNMPGRDLASALSSLSAAGLDRSLIRYSGGLEENVLYGIGGDRSGNLYSALHSFESLDSPRRRALNDRYRSAYGDDSPVLNSWAEHCYDGIHYLANLDSRELLPGRDRPTLGATATLEPKYDMHLAVAAGTRFEVL
ncbi:hypothetical protein CH282_01650 [Rhodococcus sp. 06-418-1B]|nr:ABC transporter substrate-binding protein [Rhodococcus sp. 06-418-1B]OZC92993.1 hypothetical protein CH282_01650 [Rhodococcus sp. 06-418-1B]